MSGLRARPAAVAHKIAECLAVPIDEASEFVRKALGRIEEFIKAAGPSHFLVYHQPRPKRTEVR